MSLVEYEIKVLKYVTGDRDDSIIPGAALNEAIEFLTEGGYLDNNKLTHKGAAALQRQK